LLRRDRNSGGCKAKTFNQIERGLLCDYEYPSVLSKFSELIRVSLVDISIVCPVYNEQDSVPIFLERIDAVLRPYTGSYEIVFVNDGSQDRTLEVILENRERYPQIRLINLSRNFGKESALSAGLDYSRGHAVIPIDCDLQDPPELIPEMIEQWRNGSDVVLAKRSSRQNDTVTKRAMASLYYLLHRKISHVAIPTDVGDYRLISRRVVEAIKSMPENQLFMKGIFAWVGFKTTTVEYVRPKREAGKTKFNFWKLWNLAMDGITSFSTLPIRLWLFVGFIFSFIAFIYGFFIMLTTLVWGVDVPGYASLLTIVLFMGGIQLIGIGVLGEYVGRIYIESKRRPKYIVEKEY